MRQGKFSRPLQLAGMQRAEMKKRERKNMIDNYLDRSSIRSHSLLIVPSAHGSILPESGSYKPPPPSTWNFFLRRRSWTNCWRCATIFSRPCPTSGRHGAMGYGVGAVETINMLHSTWSINLRTAPNILRATHGIGYACSCIPEFRTADCTLHTPKHSPKA